MENKMKLIMFTLCISWVVAVVLNVFVHAEWLRTFKDYVFPLAVLSLGLSFYQEEGKRKLSLVLMGGGAILLIFRLVALFAK